MKKTEFLSAVQTLQSLALAGESPGVGCIETSVQFVPEVRLTCFVFIHPRGEYKQDDILYISAIHDGDEVLEDYTRIRQYIDDLNERAGL